MSYLSAPALANICADPHTWMPTYYASVKPSFMTTLGSGFSVMPEPLIKMAFASIIAWDLKPYGPSQAETLSECLASPYLNCINYCLLAGEFSRILGGPDAGLIGWNGGVFGNHAQMMVASGGVHLYCDPTIGFLSLDNTLAGLCHGYPPLSNKWKSFFSTFHSERTNIAAFDVSVRAAIMNGTVTAEDILYWFPDIDKCRAAGGASEWATPQSWNI